MCRTAQSLLLRPGMRRTLAIFAVALTAAACGGSKSAEHTPATETVTATSTSGTTATETGGGGPITNPTPSTDTSAAPTTNATSGTSATTST